VSAFVLQDLPHALRSFWDPRTFILILRFSSLHTRTRPYKNTSGANSHVQFLRPAHSKKTLCIGLSGTSTKSRERTVNQALLSVPRHAVYHVPFVFEMTGAHSPPFDRFRDAHPTTVGCACAFPSTQLEKCTNGRKSKIPDPSADVDELVTRSSSMIKDTKDTRARIVETFFEERRQRRNRRVCTRWRPELQAVGLGPFILRS
jgi:hypothetical protein